MISNSVFLFYMHIVLTGLSVAAASYYFAGVIGAPAPRVYPVIGEKGGMGGAIFLWLLSGPISLIRLVTASKIWHSSFNISSIAAIFGALVWAFCLGVLTLEIVFQLFVG